MEPNLLFDLGYYAPLEGSHVWVVGSIQQLLLCYPDVMSVPGCLLYTARQIHVYIESSSKECLH